ncbi:MAG: nodulation protein NfeD, partial [Bacteroidales bacterium]|nr:nodulation protein NfeD [Bacteroidales bacterium]
MKKFFAGILICIAFLIQSVYLPVTAWAANAQVPDIIASDVAHSDSAVFYVIKLHMDIDKAALRTVVKGLAAAEEAGADYCIIDLNTYGGAVDAADSIRTAILKAPFPVISFVNIQAASAGALISIACDSIYMNTGSSIGAATVVNGSGEVMPDKYQSFMRAMMRSTAESQHRDPAIAQAMVSKDSVLSLTPSEAIKLGYCEGVAGSVDDVVKAVIAGSSPRIIYQTESILDKIINFLLSPVLQGILLMLIVGGIYIELQTPGIGFPLIASITAAVLYFAPLYLEGLVENWEIALFVFGLILMALEIFVIPGFGVAGISGIICMIAGLALAMVDNDLLVVEGSLNLIPILRPLAIVFVSITMSLFTSIFLAAKLYGTKAFSRIALKTDLTQDDGFVGVETHSLQHLVGLSGVVATDLKPS